MSKAPKRNSRGQRPRKGPTREIRQRFLIVCEGAKTEPNYFRAYRALAEVIQVDIQHAAGDPLGVVETAEKIVNDGKQRYGRAESRAYDQVWCVFDVDDVPIDRFNQALEKAERLGFRVAYSNQAFELWYVLHFDLLQSGIPRADYVAKLNTALGSYTKNSTAIFSLLQARQAQAIQHAEKLLSLYGPPNPYYDDPSTTVHLLVQQLNRFTPK